LLRVDSYRELSLPKQNISAYLYLQGLERIIPTMIDEIKKFKKYLMQMTSMDNESFDIAIKYLKTERVEKGKFFVKEGQICNKIAYLNKGLLRVYYLKDGIDINTCFCKENSITSSFESFVNRTPTIENIQALETTELITLSHENLIKLYELRPAWYKFSRFLTERECLRLSNRLTSLSFETAKEKYLNLLKTQPEIIKRVPIQHIASYLGISRETLSRIRSQIDS
jgi:CRP-like cAMP-binding protein